MSKDIHSKVQEAIDGLVDSGAETGVQVAAYHKGTLVVDAVAGVANSETGRAWTSDTPVFSTSTGKGVTSAVVHVLAEQGVIDYDTRIAEIWPEFGAHGKDKATVRHALTHTTGVPGLPESTTPEDLCDWDKMVTAIAEEEPWWEPGTKAGYHAQTYGYIIGELVRRASGRTIDEVLATEIAKPLGVERELFFAVPRAELDRVAKLEEMPVDPAAAEAEGAGEDFDMSAIPFFRVVNGYTAAPMAAMPNAEFGNREDVLTSPIPAGGTFSARAVAKVYAGLLGEVDGVRLVSADRLAEIVKPAFEGDDEVIGFPMSRGLGYDIGFPMIPWGSPNLFGMSGSCGTAAYADASTGLVIALNKNRCHYGQYETFSQVTELISTEIG